MGRKTRFTLQILAVSLFVMLLTVLIFTDDFVISQQDEPTSEEVEVGELEDGTFNGSADGFGGPLEVEVTVENGEIADVTVLEHSESDGVSDPAIEQIPEAIVEENSTGVEVVSGATGSSTAIKNAVNDALNVDGGETDTTEETDADTGATVDESYEDGTYTGTAEGAHGPIEVEVTIENGEITDLAILDHSETEGITDPAFEEVPPAIIETNSTEVDTVSGATATSEGIMAAVEAALDNAW